MNKFNLKRFWLTFKWLFVYHLPKTKKQLLTCAGVFFVYMFFTSVVSNYSGHNPLVLAYQTMVFGALLIYMLFFGSYILRMDRRQHYIDKLMLPATHLEKFLASYLLALVQGLAIIVISFVVADIVNYLMMLIINSDRATLVVGQLFSTSSDSEETVSLLNFLLSVLSFWWIHSLYLLGGTFFRKRHWIFTTIALVTAFNVIAGGIIFITWKTLSFFYGEHYRIVFVDGADAYIQWGAVVVMFAFIVLNYWLSFHFYKHIQLVGHSITNR